MSRLYVATETVEFKLHLHSRVSQWTITFVLLLQSGCWYPNMLI